MITSPYIQRPRAVGSAAISGGSGGVPYILAASGAAVSTTGDTNENTLATITVPGGSMGANGVLQIITSWSYTNSVNAKTLRVRFSGAAGSQFLFIAPTTTASMTDMRIIQNRNSASSQVASHNNFAPFNTTTSALVTSSVNTAVDTSIVITGQNGLGSETITLERYVVFLTKIP